MVYYRSTGAVKQRLNNHLKTWRALIINQPFTRQVKLFTRPGDVNMSLQLKSKIWFEKENRKVFGDGPWDILKRIERTGSIRQAAAEINMSYSQAWRLIKMIEQNLGFPILRKKTGGAGGGHSTLTEEASALIAAYDAFRHEANRSLERLFQKHLSPVTDRYN